MPLAHGAQHQHGHHGDAAGRQHGPDHTTDAGQHAAVVVDLEGGELPADQPAADPGQHDGAERQDPGGGGGYRGLEGTVVGHDAMLRAGGP